LNNEISNALILYPTDTIWGIGCDSLSDNAVKKIFNLKTIEYSYVSGWEVTTNSFVVKIGKQLSEKKFKSLRDTLNYLYENKRNPSMIDLRYKDGVALNYGE